MAIVRILVAVLALMLAVKSQGAATHYGTVQMDTSADWLDTGIDVNSGERLYLMPSGVHRDNSTSLVLGPGGLSTLTTGGDFSGAAENALFGRVGATNIFHIGTGGRSVVMPASGRLYVRVGDGTVAGNIGTIFLEVLSSPSITVEFDTSDPGINGWVETEYSHQAGERPLILAFGSHQDHSTSIVQGPGGLPGSVADSPEAGWPENALLFKVANWGETRYLGAGGTFPNGVTETGKLFLRLNDNDVSNNTGMIVVYIWDFVDPSLPVSAPSTTRLLGRVDTFPNPSASGTSIEYTLDASAKVTGVVYDLRGRKVRELVSDVRDAGFHQLYWDGVDDAGQKVASGAYVLVIEAGQESVRRKIAVMR